jgi:hypothetical protein
MLDKLTKTVVRLQEQESGLLNAARLEVFELKQEAETTFGLPAKARNFVQ